MIPSVISLSTTSTSVRRFPRRACWRCLAWRDWCADAGECEIDVFCGATDINTDSQVNASDLLALINAWGDCDDPEDGAPQSVEDCESTCAFHYPGGGATYTNCVQDCVEALCRRGTLPPEDCP